MQRLGSSKSGSQLSTPKSGSQLRSGSQLSKPAPKVAPKAAPVVRTSDRFNLPEGFGSAYDQNPPYEEVWTRDLIWAREAEVKHGRIAMTAVLGTIVQELAPGGVPFPWFEGEKLLALHDKLVGVGGAWQVVAFIGLLEWPFIQKAARGELDGTGALDDPLGPLTRFDLLGLAKDDESFEINRVKELKNGRLAMIAFAGIVHHYLITGKEPIEFITNPPLANCVAKASELPGAQLAAYFAPGGGLDNLCY